MKIPRKCLTDRQKVAICKEHYNVDPTLGCDNCPLMKKLWVTQRLCYRDIGYLEEFIKNFHNDEIELNDIFLKENM